MAPRANWKGYLKLSLVSCAVNLYPASSTSSRVSFNTINRKTGNKVKRQFVDAETGEVVENDDQAKGYPVAKDSYLLVSDDELDKIQIESTHTIDIEKFVPRAEIDPRYYDAPYYIAPGDQLRLQWRKPRGRDRSRPSPEMAAHARSRRARRRAAGASRGSACVGRGRPCRLSSRC